MRFGQGQNNSLPPLITEIPGVLEGFKAELKIDSEYLGDMEPGDGTEFFSSRRSLGAFMIFSWPRGEAMFDIEAAISEGKNFFTDYAPGPWFEVY
jgi:hypothetical protein